MSMRNALLIGLILEASLWLPSQRRYAKRANLSRTKSLDLGNGVKGCYVKIAAGKYSVHTRVATSPDRTLAWAVCTLGAEGLDKAPVEIAVKLLDNNMATRSGMFQRSGGRLLLSTMGVNTKFNAKALKALLDSSSAQIVDTEELWNPAKWPKPVAVAGDKVIK